MACIPHGEPHLGLPHHTANELDPETTTHLVDERDHLYEGRPSSVAKNMLTDRRISFAFSNSTICFFNRILDINKQTRLIPEAVDAAQEALLIGR
ncbi:hypothetical protein [Gordonia sp. 852002-51296_SCH5728562-b]|uniref:hypothetical protein n=1 Tax=Gordonia sp. 852002-51296_SCH5728562-b TaxID=1834101 RepID=UPI0007EB2D41|nr:hypothetical protein [Gordonia sp. 852002-51296_SCH5728562-b]OBA44005.1 hypothetical protein A5766_00200 [Gordonia sp. 852002-51296_SCH5728562-b]